MVGFGFMDNTVMLHAGNAIDLTLGVTFGLSTLSAAACGQICSDMAGVAFGGLIEKMAARLGLPNPSFSAEQRNLPIVNRVGLAGSLLGVFCGCSLGLVNLLLIDTQEAPELKLAAVSTEQGFSVELNNNKREDATELRLHGPANVDGVIAAVCTVLASNGCVIVNMVGYRMYAKEKQVEKCACGNTFMDDAVFCRKCGLKRPNVESGEGCQLSFNFYVTKDGEQVKDDDLGALARSCMAACNHPEHIKNLARDNQALKDEVQALKEQNAKTERLLETYAITVKKRDSVVANPRDSPFVGQWHDTSGRFFGGATIDITPDCWKVIDAAAPRDPSDFSIASQQQSQWTLLEATSAGARVINVYKNYDQIKIRVPNETLEVTLDRAPARGD